jgi:predicted ABC-type ATPase
MFRSGRAAAFLGKMAAMSAEAPNVIVLAGPNGAGKTTASRTLLADALALTAYVNADVIAQGLAGFDPDSAAVQAGRILLERLDELAQQRANFSFETTLSGRAYLGRLRALRDSGYLVHLIYFWLESADLAVQRVALRVAKGGHHVPEETVRQRYRRSVANFLREYRPVAATWRLFDNTAPGEPRLVAEGDGSGREVVLEEPTWLRIQQQVQS